MRTSFDLFDTLIARRCVAPTAMWADLERTSGVAGLAQARMAQGHRLWSEGAQHTTVDMYEAALRTLGQGDATVIEGIAQRLADQEYAAEQRELVPVRRHLLALSPGDWVISDMHHPDWLLHRLLLLAGESIQARWPVTLVRTNRGKHDGDVWRQLRSDCGVFNHLGDNSHADVSQAQAFGHQAQHTQWTLPTAAERAVGELGATSIMRAARSARLRCVGEVGGAGGAMSLLEEAVASHVFPVLALGALLLRDAMTQLKATKIIFCGRDGATWMRVFAALYPQVPTWVLPSSRLSLSRGSPHYAQLVKSHLGDSGDALLADLCGTGSSWAVFCERWAIAPRPLVFLNAYAGAPERLDDQAWSQGLVNVKFGDGGMVFEALCEETYPGLVDASACTELGADLVWAKPADGAHLAVNRRMMEVLDVAISELKFELGRANEQVDGVAAKSVMSRLLTGLAPLAAVVEHASGFGQRNRVTADLYRL